MASITFKELPNGTTIRVITLAGVMLGLKRRGKARADGGKLEVLAVTEAYHDYLWKPITPNPPCAVA